jgi:BA14K-like protein
MRLTILAALAASLVAAPLTAQAAPAPAPATPAEILSRVEAGGGTAAYAQYRRYYGGPRHGYYGRPYGYGRGYYGRPYGYYYGHNSGNAAAAGVAGLAAGALIGGAIASQQAQAAPAYGVADPNAVAYCSRRYRSYDPATGTFLGNDGLRHPCP